MKKIPFFLPLLLTLTLLFSCSKPNQIEFIVENDTETQIDSVRVYPSGYDMGYYHTIQSGKNQSIVVDMSDIPTHDGDYTLEYKIKSDTLNEVKFGYYTNGFALEDRITISIQQDSILYSYD